MGQRRTVRVIEIIGVLGRSERPAQQEAMHKHNSIKLGAYIYARVTYKTQYEMYRH